MPIAAIYLKIPPDSADKIIFLTFKISLEDSLTDRYSFTLISSTLADGSIKKPIFTKPFEVEKNYLYFELSADQKGMKRYEKVENPLQKEVEYPEENGQFGKVLMRKKTGTFTIRFQYTPSLKYLLIDKPGIDSLILKPIYRAEILP